MRTQATRVTRGFHWEATCPFPKGLSNLTTFIVHLTHIGSVLLHKGICNFKIFQLKCFWQSLAFRLGLVILAVPNGSPWIAVFAQRASARIQSEFFPTFLDGETSCWFVKRRLINCPLSCRIAWFLKKLTKGLFRIQVFCFVRISNPSNQLQARHVYQTQVLPAYSFVCF